MKDTVPGMDHTRELIKVVKSQIPQFEIYSGFDDNFAHNVLSGGNGCIGGLFVRSGLNRLLNLFFHGFNLI